MKSWQQLGIIWKEKVEGEEKSGKIQSPEEYKYINTSSPCSKGRFPPKILKKITKEVEGKQIGIPESKGWAFQGMEMVANADELVSKTKNENWKPGWPSNGSFDGVRQPANLGGIHSESGDSDNM